MVEEVQTPEVGSAAFLTAGDGEPVWEQRLIAPAKDEEGSIAPMEPSSSLAGPIIESSIRDPGVDILRRCVCEVLVIFIGSG